MKAFDPRLPIIARAAGVKTCHAFHCWHAMRDMGALFHVEAYAEFAGLEPKHVLAIMAALGEHGIAKAPTAPRGTRLPMDWTLPPEWSLWASQTRQWEPSECAEEALLFADYWQSRAGAGAIKIDWQKTWRNWCRTSRRPQGTWTGRTVAPLDRAEQLRKQIALYERMGRGAENEAAIAELEQLTGNVVPFSRAI